MKAQRLLIDSDGSFIITATKPLEVADNRIGLQFIPLDRANELVDPRHDQILCKVINDGKGNLCIEQW